MRAVGININPYHYFFNEENGYLSEEDKKRYNACVITDVHTGMDNTVYINCMLFNDDDAVGSNGILNLAPNRILCIP